MKIRISELTYADLSRGYGVELCTGECAESGHDDGFVRYGRVHFRERGVTRSGLRKFLMLVHDVKVWPTVESPRLGRLGTAMWLHSRNVWAYRAAHGGLGIRLPRSLSQGDRARARYLIAQRRAQEPPKALLAWARE